MSGPNPPFVTDCRQEFKPRVCERAAALGVGQMLVIHTPLVCGEQRGPGVKGSETKRNEKQAWTEKTSGLEEDV